MKATEDPIVIEETYNKPADVVWRAITEVDQMRSWFFNNIPAFKAEVGFETQFNVTCEERVFPHVWKITEVEPGKKIVYSWKYAGWPGDYTVTFELTEDNETTTLKVTSVALEDSPDDVPEFKREAGVAGWTYFIQDSLKKYLDS